MSAFFSRLIDRLPTLFASLPSGEPSLMQRWRRGFFYVALNRVIGFAIPFVTRNRFRVVEIRPGYLKATIPLRGNRNHISTMYAGAMFLLAEIPGGVMALFDFGSGYYPVLKELTMTYLQLAKTDLTVEFSLTPKQRETIRRQADQDGKCDFSLSANLIDTSGNVVAKSMGHYQLRRRPTENLAG